MLSLPNDGFILLVRFSRWCCEFAEKIWASFPALDAIWVKNQKNSAMKGKKKCSAKGSIPSEICFVSI
jgi:hypothetical protein